MSLVFEKEKGKMCARDEQVHNLNYPVVATWHYTYYMGIELNHKNGFVWPL